MGRSRETADEREKEKEICLFTKRIRRTIEDFHMIGTGQTVLAAVSGGADSVCLLAVLVRLSGELSFQVRAVHVEHGLRGQESMDDCAYVQRLCAGLGVPLTVRHIRAAKLAKESGRTVEEEARVQRYRIFQQTALETGAQRIAVAHHMEDQAETVLWNLVRGSSLRGLSGIRPVRRLTDAKDSPLVIRPLLGVSRSGIEAYLSARGIPFRTDRTNFDREITRNRIRLDVMPRLEQLNRQAQRHIADTAGQIAETEDYLERVTDAAAKRCIRTEAGDGMPILLLGPFLGEDPVIRKRILRECIRLSMPGGTLKDIGQIHAEDLMKLSAAANGKSVSLPVGVRAVREKGIIRFQVPDTAGRAEDPKTGRAGRTDGRPPGGEPGAEGRDSGAAPGGCMAEISLPFEGEKEVRCGGYRFTLRCLDASAAPSEVPRKPFTKWIAYDTIPQSEGHMLRIRTRRPGDFLYIGSDGGRKKLSDYFIDQKVPREKRDSVVLLAVGSHVLWVVGGRISEGAKVKPGSGCVRVDCRTADPESGEDYERDSQCADSGGQGRGADLPDGRGDQP